MRVAKYYNKKVKVKQFAKEIWFGKRYCRLGLNTVHSAMVPELGRSFSGS
jgi:hypothetical protein